MRTGFTLIELLAVIVILAIIALIATPIVLNIINDAKESSDLRTVDFYLDAVEYAISNEVLNNGGLENRDYPIMKDGNLCKVDLVNEECPETDGKSNILEVEVNGEKPTSGFITIENGNITDISINLNNKTIVKNDKGELDFGDEKEKELCIANTEKATAWVWKGDEDPSQLSSYERQEVGLLASIDGTYTPGVAYTCNFIDDSEANNMTFYVLSETENEVTLISGTSLGDSVVWSEDGSNHKDEPEEAQGVTAKAALLDRTSTWKKLNDTQKATIKIPTLYQIAEALGKDKDHVTSIRIPTWLNSHSSSEVSGGTYWTSTICPDEVGMCAGEDAALYIIYYYEPGLIYGIASNRQGIRPVITLSKDVLK